MQCLPQFPTIIGQKAWREERVNNINAAIKALVVAINAERDKQNECVRKSVNKTYTYYMQNLNRLIEENKALESANEALKVENTKVKERISKLDENEVKRVTAQKGKEIAQLKENLATANNNLASLGNDYKALMSKYKCLVLQWNDLRQQPEIVAAIKRVGQRQQQEVEEIQRQEAEAKCEEQARKDRYQGVLDRFIDEGHGMLATFSQSNRIDFNEQESNAIYYGVIATAVKHGLPLDAFKGIETSVDKFLDGMNRSGCSDFRRECVSNWTRLFATKEVVYADDIVSNFLSSVDNISCSAEAYVSLGGSNGCADQLTNWDGTEKLGLGAPKKKNAFGRSK